MRLADFIVANREAILAEWEQFARTCAPASGSMDIKALRDHASEMLTAIAADLGTPQDREEQAEKSKGLAPEELGATTTAAELHGGGRADSGFTVEQMVAEYRALRASVIRLWTHSTGQLVPEQVEDLTRFNESIDQSLAESVSQFNENVEQSKEIFLAILGHDLRTPLGAIYTSARFMLETDGLNEPQRVLTERIALSATRTTHLVGDLLDFTRSRLGGGIPVVREEMSLTQAAQEVADEVRASSPGYDIRVESSGDERGEWDRGRIGQALTNLITNAVQHGGDDAPVTIKIRGEGDEVAVEVHNTGEPIPSSQMDGIFNPMKERQSPRKSATGPTGGLGLGLYIAERIVSAHHGRINVDSSKSGTTFTIHLPRFDRAALQRPKPEPQ